MMNKKAQGLSVTTVIIAVIAVVVLVVLVLVLMGVINPSADFLGGQLTCDARGGTCGISSDKCKEQGGTPASLKCLVESQPCCLLPDDTT